MIRFSELVAALLHEFTIAKTKTLALSVQMQRDFQEHEILRQVPIPIFRINEAELTIPFAIARVDGKPSALAFDPTKLEDIATRVMTALPEQNALKKGFALYPGQIERWRSAASALARQFAAEAGQSITIDDMATIYGHLVKAHYLADILERGGSRISRRGIVGLFKTQYPDVLREQASRLIKEDLERLLGQAKAEEPADEASTITSQLPPVSSISVEIEAERLQQVAHLATVKLRLEEGILDTARIDIEGGNDDKQKTTCEGP
ncbi:MAG: hypothetical protein D6690_12555 [Nitrospirae bacterium]|nr:MAG: hypothetical protein D6690_12555 [Nitrospirota bacterium]